MTDEIQKIVTKEDIAEIILMQLKAIMEPATQQIGQNLMAFHLRLEECEKCVNALIIEMQAWKESHKVLN